MRLAGPLIVLMLGLGLSNVPVLAQLVTPPDSMMILVDSQAIPRDAPVGSQYQQPEAFRIWEASGVTCPVTKSATISGTLVPGYTDVYETSVAGIGMRFQHTSEWNGWYVTAPVSETFDVPSEDGSGAVVYYRRVILVVTGPVGEGTLTSSPVMTTTWSGDCFPTVASAATVEMGETISRHSCSVTTPAVHVSLPAVRSIDLRPTGMVEGETSFNIALDCSAGSNVFVTLTDGTDSSNRTSNLTLGSSATAKGVGLQILHDGAPVSFGPDSTAAGNENQFRIGASDDVSNITLSARYVSTDIVVPGTVAATATFTMSYQ